MLDQCSSSVSQAPPQPLKNPVSCNSRAWLDQNLTWARFVLDQCIEGLHESTMQGAVCVACKMTELRNDSRANKMHRVVASHTWTQVLSRSDDHGVLLSHITESST